MRVYSENVFFAYTNNKGVRVEWSRIEALLGSSALWYCNIRQLYATKGAIFVCP
jgi:hypothetical protein